MTFFLRPTSLLFIFTLIAQFALAAAPGSTADGEKSPKDGAGATPTYAVSGYARLTSNYLDRGLTYSNGGAAMNATFLVNLGSQFKFGFWGTNISKLKNDDDNLWVKYIAEVLVEFQPNSKFVFYFHDDHFYKTQSMNGLRYGFRLDWSRFSGLLEWQNNYEGTGASSYYIRGRFNKKYSDKGGIELGAGYTNEYSHEYKNYVDMFGTAYFNAIPNGRLEVGMTLPTNTAQFDNRSNPGYFAGLMLSF
jgi:hypothetical protein